MDAKARKQFPQHHRHSFAYSAGGGGVAIGRGPSPIWRNSPLFAAPEKILLRRQPSLLASHVPRVAATDSDSNHHPSELSRKRKRNS
jgi:hypothetical protein